jgi:hypothetical protein
MNSEEFIQKTNAQQAQLVGDAAALFMFAGRRDLHAQQRPDGQYWTVREPITSELLQRHLSGELTVGAYVVAQDLTCAFVILDFDYKPPMGIPPATEIQKRVEKALLVSGLNPRAYLLEFSGFKGYHAWLFFDPPLPQKAAYRIGRFLKRLTGAKEAFPKQPDVTRTKKGLGNLIKLPLAIHRTSSQRSHLIGEDGELDARPLADILAGVATHPREAVEHFRFEDDEESFRKEPAAIPRLPSPRRLCLDNILAAGVSVSERGGRQSWAWRLGLYMRDRGVSIKEACETIRTWNRRNRPPLYDAEAAKQVENAYAEEYRLPGCGNLPYCVPHSCPLFVAEHPELVQGAEVELLADRGWARYFGRAWKSALAVYTGIVVLERRLGKQPGHIIFASRAVLAEASGVGGPTVSRILRRLAKAGLIAYVPGGGVLAGCPDTSCAIEYEMSLYTVGRATQRYRGALRSR